MANLAEDTTSALLRIVQPMIGRKESGIHAIVEGQWFTCFAQKRLHSDGERSETAVETDHEKRGVIVGMGGGDFNGI